MHSFDMPFGLAIAESSDEGPIWDFLEDGDPIFELYPEPIDVTDDLYEGFRDCTIKMHLTIPSMTLVFAIAGVLTEICGGGMQDPQLVARDLIKQHPSTKLVLPELARTQGIYSSEMAIKLAQECRNVGW